MNDQVDLLWLTRMMNSATFMNGINTYDRQSDHDTLHGLTCACAQTYDLFSWKQLSVSHRKLPFCFYPRSAWASQAPFSHSHATRRIWPVFHESLFENQRQWNFESASSRSGKNGCHQKFRPSQKWRKNTAHFRRHCKRIPWNAGMTVCVNCVSIPELATIRFYTANIFWHEQHNISFWGQNDSCQKWAHESKAAYLSLPMIRLSKAQPLPWRLRPFLPWKKKDSV